MKGGRQEEKEEMRLGRAALAQLLMTNVVELRFKEE